MSIAARLDSNPQRRPPNILIEDAARNSAYYIPAEEMDAFKAGARTWVQVSANTVAFNIPSDETDSVPPYTQNLDANPSVLIRFSAGKAAYFLTNDQLQNFKIPPGTPSGDEVVRFVIPRRG